MCGSSNAMYKDQRQPTDSIKYQHQLLFFTQSPNPARSAVPTDRAEQLDMASAIFFLDLKGKVQKGPRLARESSGCADHKLNIDSSGAKLQGRHSHVCGREVSDPPS